MRWGMLMRGDAWLLCEPCWKCFGESEEGGLPAPLGHNGKKKKKQCLSEETGKTHKFQYEAVIYVLS